MRIEPVDKTKKDPFAHLKPIDKAARKVAIFVAFVSVFVWMIKIIFL